jgi:hypothetical protein
MGSELMEVNHHFLYSLFRIRPCRAAAATDWVGVRVLAIGSGICFVIQVCMLLTLTWSVCLEGGVPKMKIYSSI